MELDTKLVIRCEESVKRWSIYIQQCKELWRVLTNPILVSLYFLVQAKLTQASHLLAQNKVSTVHPLIGFTGINSSKYAKIHYRLVTPWSGLFVLKNNHHQFPVIDISQIITPASKSITLVKEPLLIKSSPPSVNHSTGRESSLSVRSISSAAPLCKSWSMTDSDGVPKEEEHTLYLLGHNTRE